MTPRRPARPWGRSFPAVLAVLAVTAAACGAGDGTPDAARDTSADLPTVTVTTTILGDVVANVAGEGATVEVLMPRGADPHSFEASAQQAAAMRDADLIVANGLGLEEGLTATIDAAEDDGARVLWIGAQLDPQPFDAGLEHGHADEDDDQADEEGDDHEGEMDPHVWMDPLRVADAVDLIADDLAAVGVAGVADRAATYRMRIEDLSASIAERIESIPAPNRTMVTNHLAYGYYADRYGLELLGAVIPGSSTQAATSAAGFSELVELIRREQVPAIFASTTESTDLADTISDEIGRDVAVVELYTGSLGEPGSGAETYLGMMDVSTDRIVEALS